MTPERAIEILEGGSGTMQELNEAAKMAVNAINIHFMAQKPIDTVGRFYGKHKGGKCPKCGAGVNSAYNVFCRNCGQRIEWQGVFRQPYRNGDIVYMIIPRFTAEKIGYQIISKQSREIVQAKVVEILNGNAVVNTGKTSYFNISPDDYFKKVFPTRELAEKYLRGEFECVLED